MHIMIVISLLFFFNQSAEALNMVKHDLSEFVSTIQHDTSAVVADTATAVKESLKVTLYKLQKYSTLYSSKSPKNNEPRSEWNMNLKRRKAGGAL